MEFLPMLVFAGLLVYGFMSVIKRNAKPDEKSQGKSQAKPEQKPIQSDFEVFPDQVFPSGPKHEPAKSETKGEGESSYDFGAKWKPYVGSLGVASGEGESLFADEIQRSFHGTIAEAEPESHAVSPIGMDLSEVARCFVIGEVLSKPKCMR